jgi:hypothetical protein
MTKNYGMIQNLTFLQIPSLSSSDDSFHEAMESEPDEEADDSDADSEGQNASQNFRSTARIRGMLETVVKRVLTKSQTNLASSKPVKVNFQKLFIHRIWKFSFSAKD